MLRAVRSGLCSVSNKNDIGRDYSIKMTLQNRNGELCESAVNSLRIYA